MSKEDKSKIDKISISTLEISNLLTTGKKIATISVGSTSYNILAPATYAWSEITDRPTKLSQFTDDVVVGKYLPLTGGTVTGNLFVKNTSWGGQLRVVGDNTQAGIDFYHDDTNIGRLVTYAPDKLAWYDVVSNKAHVILHSGNVGDYALVNRGNRGAIDFNNVLDSGFEYTSGSSTNNGKNYGVLATFRVSDSAWQIVGGSDVEKLLYRSGRGNSSSWGDWKTLAFTDSDITGNAGSATKLQTARTIWGQSFDGTANVSGNMSEVGTINNVFKVLSTQGIAQLNVHEVATDVNYSHLYVSSNNTSYPNTRPLVLQYGYGNVGIGIIAPTQKLDVNGNVKATSFIGNLDGTYVNKLTGYTKATAISALAATDTLNTALGKLEYKADVAYNLVKGAYDGDGTIENLEEILRVLEGISDTDTIQAIIGKYLPLTGGTITGNSWLPLRIVSDNTDSTAITLSPSSGNGLQLGWTSSQGAFIYNYQNACQIGVHPDKYPYFKTSSNWYTILHSGNYNTYAPKLDGTGATGTWNINISGTAADANTLAGHANGDVTARYFNSLLLTKTNTLDNISDGVYCWANADNPTNSVGDNSALLQLSGRKWDRFQLAFPGNNNGKIFFRNSTYESTNTWIWTGWKQLAFTSDIPTKTSQLTNDSGYLTSTSLNNYVTLNTAQTITGLKTFESNSSTTGVSLILKNKGWAGSMSTAVDFYNGAHYSVPNARIETKMVGSGSAGGTLIFYTQTAHASTNPNPNGLVERLRIDDGGNVKVSGTLNVANSIYTSESFYLQSRLRLHSNNGNELWVNYGGGAKDGDLYLCGYNMRFYSGNSANYHTSMYMDANGYISIGMGATSASQRLQVSGYTLATGFMRSGSSDSYLLLGGGGHKAISDFLLKSELANQELSNNLTTITKSLTVTADWMDTGIKSTDLATGTYIVQVSVNAPDAIGYMYSNIFSGVMSWSNAGTNDNESDEIILHRAGVGYGKTIYLRTKMSGSSEGTNLRLQIAASHNIGAAYTYTFKFKRVI